MIFFCLAVASNNEPFRGVLDFLSFLFPSVCLFVSQPVSVHLFRINLKFLKTRKY